MSTTPAPVPPCACDGRRAPLPPRPVRQTQPAPLLDLSDEQDFLRRMERACLNSRRQDEALSVLQLQAHFATPVDEPLRAELLDECARRLCRRLRAADSVMRWQGLHFGVFLHRCEAGPADAVLQRLSRYAGGHYRVGAQLLKLEVQGRLRRCETR